MLELYDKKHAFVGQLFDYESLKTESEAATGDSTLSFTYLGDKTLEAEMYVRDESAEYVIKEVSETGDSFPEIVAALNLEDLQGEMWQTFSVTEVTIDEATRAVLAGTGWTVGECTVTKKRNAGMIQVSTLEVIQKLCTAFMCEPVFDTINKTVSFYAERGEDKGVYFLKGLNLAKVQKDSTSYDYYTRIIPVGENGLTITDVNGGKNYLENFQYSDKLLTYLWKDESYTDAQALMEDAELKLKDLSKPSVSYTAEIRNLAAQKPEYSILSYGLGDTVWIIDRETGTREKQRIVKLTRYPDAPEKDTCELSSTVPTFETMQEKYNAAAEIINYTVTGDGRYTGTINVSDILNFETGLSTSGTISGINSSLATLEGELGLVKLSVGQIEVNYLKAEDAELKYAHIDLSNIEKGCITTAMIGTGVVGTAQIADGSITDAKIVDLTANKITAGILSVERLEIRGSTNSIVYELNNITGALQAQNVDTLNGEILTQRSITADKIVANAITSNEIAAKTITANEIAANTITAAEIDVIDLFAQDITAYGTISGVTINGGTINGGTINSTTLNSGTINGGTINSTTLNSVTLNAATGNFSGTVTASSLTATSSGTIACWTINSSSIYRSSATYGASGGMYFGTSGLSISSTFKVSSGGALTCTGATITGSITATSMHIQNALYLFSGSNASNMTAIGYSGSRLVLNGDSGETQVGSGVLAFGSMYVTGKTVCYDEIQSTMNSGSAQFRAIGGDYGFMIRNDGTNTYFLLTNSGSPTGSWNSLRPLYINNYVGTVTIGGGLNMTSNLAMNSYNIYFNNESGIRSGDYWVIRQFTTTADNSTAIGCGNASQQLRLFTTNSKVWLHNSTTTYFSTTSSSDERLKKSFAELGEDFEQFYMSVKPVSFRYILDESKLHYGLKAQEVIEAAQRFGLSPDCNLYGSENAEKFEEAVIHDNTVYHINYLEWVPVNMHMIQKNVQNIEKLRLMQESQSSNTAAEITRLESKNEALQMQLDEAFDRIAKLEKLLEAA